MCGDSTRRQRDRLQLARNHGAHLVEVTARHGYARFHLNGDAERFVSIMMQSETLGMCDVRVYDMHSQIAVDWTDEPRYANGGVVR